MDINPIVWAFIVHELMLIQSFALVINLLILISSEALWRLIIELKDHSGIENISKAFHKSFLFRKLLRISSFVI